MAVRIIKKGNLEYLAADNISAPHCFTTRHGGISKGYLESMNLGADRGEPKENVEKNFAILGRELGFDIEDLVLTHQTHSVIVRNVTKQDAKGVDHHAYPESDGLISNDPGTALVVFAADCTPILLHDPVTGAVGAAHAGWRGTAGKIAAITAQAMIRDFGCDPKNICAAIGPNIAQCCFETDADVPEAMRNAYGAAAEAYIRKSKEKFYVNLKALNALALQEVGVENIQISDLCTACQPDRFWSFRRIGGRRGSQGGIIVCKEAGL